MGFEVGRIGIQRSALFTGYLPLFQGVATHVKCCPPKCHHLQILHIIKITGRNSNSHTCKFVKINSLPLHFQRIKIIKNLHTKNPMKHLSKESHFLNTEREISNKQRKWKIYFLKTLMHIQNKDFSLNKFKQISQF